MKRTRCAWCGGVLVHPHSGGRPRTYCRTSCRQRAYEARSHAARLGLGDDTVVVSAGELERLRDLRFAVTTVLDDVGPGATDASDVDWVVASLRDALG